ncbi:MAG: transglycosylase domain-containing protein [Deltaproteobacteria bacterium]|nr:MAG: transglycosylase domain-containing protein [Deltaproteobacteria bacterium]
MGEYIRGANQVSIFLHSFSYPSGDIDGVPIQISFAERKITSIVRLDNQEVLKTVKLEPELVASIFDEKMEDRTLVSMTDIPDALLNAVVAVEDERFYSHHGVDPIGLARALLVDLVHLKAVQGGSTLTQQLVKNYFLTSKKTFGRKLNEMVMALILEARYTKEEILEAYLNEIYFGQRGAVSVTGVEEAAKMFFSKSVSQLSIAECALIAGVIRSPGEYSPFRNINKAYDRRNFVLKMMWSQDVIDDREYADAKKEKIILSPVNNRFLRAPYFVDFIQTQLKSDYSTDVLKSEGLRIFTTLDPLAQDIAEEALQKHLEKLEADKPKLKKNREEGKTLEGVFVAVQPQTGAIRAFVGGGIMK